MANKGPIMQRTISKQLAITYLDNRLNKCDSAIATMQLESYYTNDEPPLKIGAINPVSRQYAHDIGDTVDVEPRILVNYGCLLTNVIRSEFLENYIRSQR